LLLENHDMRVFAVTLPPHQESYVRHEHNFLTVTLQDSAIVMWRQGESPIQHFPAAGGEVRFFADGWVRGMRNDSNAEYRNVTVEFLDPRVTNYGYRPDSGQRDYGPSTLNPPVDPHGRFVDLLDLELAVAQDVQLLPKDTLPAPQPRRRELLVAGTSVNLAAGDTEKILLKPGEVRSLEGRTATLVNEGAAPARFTLVEIK
jgi:hypothetical protein